MVGAPVAPGVDVPMEGNIVWTSSIPRPFSRTDNKWLDDSTYNDRDHSGPAIPTLVRRWPSLWRFG